MKAAPIIKAIDDYNKGLGNAEADAIRHVFVHTGQHYDEGLSEAFFKDLRLPRPDVFLGAGSGTHASQTAQIMASFEPVMLNERPDAVVVTGDVNSTLACALTASKISYGFEGRRPLIAHVEAGLRSFDRSMPEEINRVITDHVSDILLVTEDSGLKNLKKEGIGPEKIHFVGNTMIDTLLSFKRQAAESAIIGRLGLAALENGGAKDYALLTLHRPSNVDNKESLKGIISALLELPDGLSIVFPAHPRTRKRISEYGLGELFESGRIRTTGPLGYIDFLSLMMNSKLVLTDSGGVQEETTCLGVPCVTIRENTERPVTIECGTNVIAGTSREGILRAARYQLAGGIKCAVPEKWDGMSAVRIVDILIKSVRKTRLRERPECETRTMPL